MSGGAYAVLPRVLNAREKQVNWHDVSRRGFLRMAGAAALLAGRGARGRGGVRPNLLVIHTDEHNFRTLGCYRALSRELAAYAARHRDPYADAPRIKADLKWAIEGTGDYEPPNVPAHTPSRGGRRNPRRKQKQPRNTEAKR